jgi:hypothetical protein
LLREGPVVVAGGLDEGDRPSEAGTLISAHRLGEGINVDGLTCHLQ